jgi:hypothetical protein
MMKMIQRHRTILFLCLLLLFSFELKSQKLQPGFSYDEFVRILGVTAYQVDTPWVDMSYDYPTGFILEYRSNKVALLNRWDLWVSEDSLVVISVRGTVGDFESWLENFYAAMVPATGSVRINSSEYVYSLSTDSKSAVHAGWLLAYVSMRDDVISRFKDCINRGYHDFIITGHSQGGAIAFLLSADLNFRINNDEFPNDVRVKTICSAAPKPGNINFAREYSYLTQEGWAYNVVNAADWVPEVPFSVQTMNDFNVTNPLSDRKKAMSGMGLLKRIVIGSAYRSIERPLNKTVHRFQKNLGKRTYKMVRNYFENLSQPDFFESNYYVPAGIQIILYPDSAYYNLFPDRADRTFTHHMLKPYLYLSNKQKAELEK